MVFPAASAHARHREYRQQGTLSMDFLVEAYKSKDPLSIIVYTLMMLMLIGTLGTALTIIIMAQPIPGLLMLLLALVISNLWLLFYYIPRIRA